MTSNRFRRVQIACLLSAWALVACADKGVTRGPDDPHSTFELRLAKPDPNGSLILRHTGARFAAVSEALVTQRDIRAVGTHEFDEGDCGVNIQLTPSAASRLASSTAARVGQTMAVIVDGEIVAAPELGSPLSELVQLRAGFKSCDEAAQLARRIAP